uniref:phosphodiester glycosidase family protein n=1 Tax=Prevotella heparinolytica TaxID=28113 RepID=UPI00359F139B
GRRKGKAEGISIPELTHMVRVLGGKDALNLDGGGSSTLWSSSLPDEGIANTLSGKAERKVANSLCVYE